MSYRRNATKDYVTRTLREKDPIGEDYDKPLEIVQWKSDDIEERQAFDIDAFLDIVQEYINLSPSMVRAIREIYLSRDRGHNYYPEEFEVHELESGAVMVPATFGTIKNGKKTSVAYYGTFIVGKRGGISASVDSKKVTKSEAKKYPTIYGWRLY